MKIIKSDHSWKYSCRELFDSIICLLTFDAFEFTEKWRIQVPWRYDKGLKRRVQVWWHFVSDIPEQLIEVLTLGRFTLRQSWK